MAVTKSRTHDLYQNSVSDDELTLTIKHLSSAGPISSIGIVVRMPDWVPEQLSRIKSNSYESGKLISKVYHREEGAVQHIRNEWCEVNSETPQWNRIIDLPHIHCCIIEGPTSHLIRLLQHQEIRSLNSPIAAIIRSFPVVIPEGNLVTHLPPSIRADLENVITDASSPQSMELMSCLESFQKEGVLCANIFHKLMRQFRSITPFSDRLRWIINNGTPIPSYLDGLGIGQLSAFGPNGGADTKVCILDSGADESHLMLQEKVAFYDRYDMAGQFKEAHASTDAGCHGTKMASIIAGQAASFESLGVDREYVERFLGSVPKFCESDNLQAGLAPAAKLFVCGILGGPPLAESGTHRSILSGLEWAASKCEFCCINMSIETQANIYDEGSRTAITNLCHLMMDQFKIPVILAAGNRPDESEPFARDVDSCLVVGAADRGGQALDSNGPFCHVLAPGNDLICAQPPLACFGERSFDLYHGTSVATAVTSASIALLCGRFPYISGAEAAQVLLATSNGTSNSPGMINVSRAAQNLRDQGHDERKE